jgi:hypothetical protein
VNIPRDLRTLTRLFEKLGAKDAKLWASSQIKEGIPQLQRYLFLRQAWRNVLEETDVTWIEREIREAERSPDGPYAGLGAALRRCVALGVQAQDLTDIARAIQAQMLFRFCYLLDDPAFTEPELSELSWGLFAEDADGKPAGPRIGSLHESVLETDPTGREMRPRQARGA